MKKCNTILILFLCISLNSVSQTVTWGPETENENSIISHLGADENYFYFLSGSFSGHSSYSLEKYSLNDLKPAASYRLDFQKFPDELGGKGGIFQKAYMSGGNIYAVSITVRRKLTYVAIQKFDFTSGTLSQDLRLVDTVPEGYKLVMSQSYDKGKFLIAHSVGDEKNVSFSVKVFDDKLEMVHYAVLKTGIPEKDCSIGDLFVTSDGMAVMPVIEPLKVKNKKEPNYRYVLYLSDKSSAETGKLILDAGKSFILNITLSEAKNKKIYCSGFYSDDNESRSDHTYAYTSTSGIYFSMLDRSNSQIQPLKFPYTSEILDEAIPERSKKKNPEELTSINNMKIKDVLFNEDGSFTILSEASFIQDKLLDSYTRSSRPGYSNQYYQVYWNNKGLITDLSKDLKLEKSYLINKSQGVDYTNNYSGYVYYADQGVKYILYNDAHSNSKDPDKAEFVMSFPDKALGNVVKIKFDGSRTSKYIYDNDEMKMKAMPSYSVMYNGKLFLPAQSDKKLKFGAVIFQ